ncbi:MAG: 3-dehydroquinate synthase [Bacteroidetes bacterium GWE2_29_8]|nr:MAG: 3-dehydroquinate synthase [Bacteroidetes bacterium GWE2_29_8]OFY24860.1 MAG: 3-dehydroquinate synthase [Bacteroidetes bacterium GWF2_29_10]
MIKKLELNQTKIIIGERSINEIDKEIKKINYSKIFILVDENTHQYCLPKLIINSELLKEADIIEIESGESQKTLDTSFQLWEVLAEYKADRNILIINLGGGVISDMGGFIASIYKRGVKFINIPTTLLSQIDASIGGKTGIDLGSLKNMLGTFTNPELIIIDPDFLDTLDKRNIYSGFGEIIKHALIYDKKYWNKIKLIDLNNISEIKATILNSVNIKVEIVQKDPKEEGLRKILNFGHTIGHSLESIFLNSSKDFLYHGEAIVAGIICELYLSMIKLNFKEEEASDIIKFIKPNFKLNKIKKSNYDLLIDFMQNDKKNTNDNIAFSLLNDIGNCSFNIFCSQDEIIQSFDYYNKIIK